MLTLDSLPKTKSRNKKRLGRGIGSGKGGHTSSRGQKGQKSRSKIHPLFDGQKNKKSLIQRLPILRGKGKLKSDKYNFTLTLNSLNSYKDNDTVTLENLISKHLLPVFASKNKVKLVSTGDIKKKLKVAINVTPGAEAKIKSAGGEILI